MELGEYRELRLEYRRRHYTGKADIRAALAACQLINAAGQTPFRMASTACPA